MKNCNKHNALQILTGNPDPLQKYTSHKMRQGSTYVWSLEAVSIAGFEDIADNQVCGKENNNIKDSTESRKTTRNLKTRGLQLQATVKRSRFDLNLDLESQYTLISLWF